MAADMQQLITPWNYPIALQPPTYDAPTMCEQMEKILKEKVSDYRMGMDGLYNHSLIVGLNKLRR